MDEKNDRIRELEELLNKNKIDLPNSNKSSKKKKWKFW
jgi:hypothetical protein